VPLIAARPEYQSCRIQFVGGGGGGGGGVGVGGFGGTVFCIMYQMSVILVVNVKPSFELASQPVNRRRQGITDRHQVIPLQNLLRR
jgi:hypothetical protein